MELVAQIGGLAGLASLVGVLLAFLIRYRKSSTDAFAVASKAFNDHLESSRKDFHAQIAGFQAQLAGFQSQVGNLQIQMETWQGLYKAQTEENQKLVAEVVVLKTKIEQLTSEIDKLRTENHELKGLLKASGVIK